MTEKTIRLFEKVRDIPYGSIGSRNPAEVYRKNMGTCSGKHELLKELYEEAGVEARDFIALHRFRDLSVRFPDELECILNRTDIVDPHNFLKILVGGRWITVDATWDLPLNRLGFTVNEGWDGKSDMKLCVAAFDVFEVEDPMESKKRIIEELPRNVQADRKLFLKRLSGWLSESRRK